MMDKLRLAIISDLHCLHSSKDKEGSKSSYLYSDNLRQPISKHPISALKELITSEKLLVDYLICPGDITHQVDAQGLISGMGFLKEINKAIRSKDIIISTGNHDVDTFRKHDNLENALALVKKFSEFYPTKDLTLNKNYWANGYCIIKKKNFNVINLNSCSNLLAIIDKKKIIIDESIIDNIKKELEEFPVSKNDFNIIVLHHHPIKHSNTDELDYPDNDSLGNGEKLLDSLRPFGFDFVIHGHKHWARISNYNSTNVFCSGSFSSTANVSFTSYTNLFHIIELVKDGKKTKGKIFSWDYSHQHGWAKSTDSRKIPYLTGFGTDKKTEIIAQEIIEAIDASGKTFISREELIKNIPEFDFLNMESQQELTEALKNRNIVFDTDVYSDPQKIIKFG